MCGDPTHYSNTKFSIAKRHNYLSTKNGDVF